VKIEGGPTVPTPDASRFSSGEKLFAVVRPEKLEVAQPGEGPSDLPGIEGMVESSLFIGTATQLGVRVADDSMLTVLVPNASESERQRLPGAGARIHLSWEPDHMHLVTESSNGSGPNSTSSPTNNYPQGEEVK
jgi:spermidine/putrescine transport system ATP-binding protein